MQDAGRAQSPRERGVSGLLGKLLPEGTEAHGGEEASIQPPSPKLSH